MGGNAICAGGGEGVRFERSSPVTGWPFMLQSKKKVRIKETTEPMKDSSGSKKGGRHRPGSRRRSISPDCLVSE